MKRIIAISIILIVVGALYLMWPPALQIAASDTTISMENGVLANVLLPKNLSQSA